MSVSTLVSDRLCVGCKPLARVSSQISFAPFKPAAAHLRQRASRRSSTRVYAVDVPSGVNLPPALADAVSSAPPEVLYAAGAAAVGLLGLIGWGIAQAGKANGSDVAPGSTTKASAIELPRENAVLVFGATGRTGALLVNKLIASGRTVVAAVRSAEKASKVFTEMGLKLGYQEDKKKGILVVEEGVDISDASTLKSNLFSGVDQVVSSVGPVYAVSEGVRGFSDNMTPARVDALGVKNIVTATQQALGKVERSVETVVPMVTPEDMEKWERLDDVIMGGQSSSSISASESGVAVWSGDLIVEGGGFCGTRTKLMSLDLSEYSGVTLRVKGDGQTYKMNIKTADQANIPEETYQATFSTERGAWSEVYLPWHAFVATKKAKVNPQGKPLDASQIKQFGLVLSRFEYNGFPNPNYQPGKFELSIDGGIKAFKDPSPQLVLVSSAGTERYASVANDPQALEQEIPIVKLNPSGILCFKYEGECAVRGSGLQYTVVRPTGLVSELPDNLTVAKLEADQGDSISGVLLREDVADTVAYVLAGSNAVGKTFEIRRGCGPECVGKQMKTTDWQRMILKLHPDAKRSYVGLTPFPVPVPYTPQAEPAPAAAVDNVASARAWIAAWKSKQSSAAPVSAAPTQKEKPVPADNGTASEQVEAARSWIAAWRSKQQGGTTNGSVAAAVSVSGEEPQAQQVPDNVQSARDWIRMWRVKQLEAQLPADLPANSKK